MQAHNGVLPIQILYLSTISIWLLFGDKHLNAAVFTAIMCKIDKGGVFGRVGPSQNKDTTRTIPVKFDMLVAVCGETTTSQS